MAATSGYPAGGYPGGRNPASDPYALMNKALGRTAGVGRGRKVRDPRNPKDAAYLRAMHPDFDELITDGDIDYKTMCRTDAEFGRKFALPPMVEPTRGFMEHSNSVDAVTWGPEPGTFVSASHDKTLKVWDAASGRCLQTLQGHPGGVYHCVAAASGKVLVSCGSGEEKNALVWAWPQKKVAHALGGHSRAVHHAAISADSTRCCTADQDGRFIVHDLSRGAKITERSAHYNIVHGTSFCREDGNLLISAGHDGSIQLLDLREWAAPAAWRMSSMAANCIVNRPSLGVDDAHGGYAVYAVEFTDKTTFFSGGADNKFKRWDLRKATCAYTRSGLRGSSSADEFLGHSASVRSLVVSPDGRYSVTGCEDGSCRLWRTNAGARPKEGSYHTALLSLVGHVGQVSCVAWRDGDGPKKSASLLSSAWDQRVQLFDVPLANLD